MVGAGTTSQPLLHDTRQRGSPLSCCSNRPTGTPANAVQHPDGTRGILCRYQANVLSRGLRGKNRKEVMMIPVPLNPTDPYALPADALPGALLRSRMQPLTAGTRRHICDRGKMTYSIFSRYRLGNSDVGIPDRTELVQTKLGAVLIELGEELLEHRHDLRTCARTRTSRTTRYQHRRDTPPTP